MKIKNIINKFLYASLFITKKVKNVFFNSNPPTPEIIRFLVWGDAANRNKKIPKIIWTYWAGERSACADACLASLMSSNKDFDIIALDNSNLINYLPDFPSPPKDLPVQLTSDLIRLLLLEKYGGIWIDRSVIVTDSLSWALDAAEQNNAEMICFYNEFHKVYKKNKSRPIIENGFIAAVKGSPFIKSWLKNYQDCILSNNWRHYYRNTENYADLITNFIEENDDVISYFSCYLSAQKTMLDSRDYKLFLINAEDEYYFYYYKTKPPINRVDFCEWILISKEEIAKPKLIKLHKKYREIADECIRLRCFNRTSILGKYL